MKKKTPFIAQSVQSAHKMSPYTPIFPPNRFNCLHPQKLHMDEAHAPVQNELLSTNILNICPSTFWSTVRKYLPGQTPPIPS